MHKKLLATFCILAALLATACEENFAPLGTSNLRYSAFGHLNASADTQWIRVMPIRSLVLTTPDSFGIRVTLEEVGAGRTIVLRDSLFLFADASNPDLGSTAYVHNYWTTQRITP